MNDRKNIEKEFGDLFKTNYSRLFYYAYEVVRDSEAAKDIVNDVFGDVWEDYDRLRSDRIESYLYRAVRNRCLNHLHHEEVVRQYQERALKFETEWESDEESFQDEDIAFMRQVLDELPPRTKFIFEQCYFFGKKYKEVAEVLELSEAAIHKHMVKTFAILREKFRERVKNR